MTSSANKESGQQKKGLENSDGLLAENDSCIHPVPAEATNNFSTRIAFSVEFLDIKPSMIIAMGHILDGMKWVCGEPMPEYSVPSEVPVWNQGLSTDKMKRLVLANISA
jgi:hypothetical protein